jgi:hypothetical protein
MAMEAGLIVPEAMRFPSRKRFDRKGDRRIHEPCLDSDAVFDKRHQAVCDPI